MCEQWRRIPRRNTFATVMTTTIDIVIPHYGSTDLLRQAVLSVVEQDSTRWALHVVEDGLQDRAIGPWLAAFDDDRIHHHVNATRLGTAANFQRCLEISTADWLTFLGCDDLMEPGYVSAILRAAESSPEAAVIHPRVQVIAHNGATSMPLGDTIKRRLAPTAGTFGGDTFLATLLHGNWAYFPAIAWRRRIIAPLGFRRDLPITLDLALLAEVLLAGHAFVQLDEPGIRYRRHSASASSVAAREVTRFDEEARLFGELAKRAHQLGWNRSARAARWRLTSRAHSLICMGQALRQRETRIAARLLQHSLRR